MDRTRAALQEAIQTNTEFQNIIVNLKLENKLKNRRKIDSLNQYKPKKK